MRKGEKEREREREKRLEWNREEDKECGSSRYIMTPLAGDRSVQWPCLFVNLQVPHLLSVAAFIYKEEEEED
jgi:hypothetical protein